MVAYFLDSSAILKRYHWEPGSAWMRAICDSRTHPPLYISRLAQLEVVASLRRTGQLKGFHPSAINSMVSRFERHIALSDTKLSEPHYIIVPVADLIIDLASDLCDQYWQTPPHLRSLDAIQLACAASAAANLPTGALELVTADTRLAAIARQEGFTTINPAFAPLP